ncbi:uncharacterized protein ACJ7VT_004610 [Polymixia lowei]
MMKAHLWSCLLGLFYIPAVITVTVSQNPHAILLMKVNSSAEIRCSTSLSGAVGLYLQSYFHGDRNVAFLALRDGEVLKTTIHGDFREQIDVVPTPELSQGCGFTFRLSLLDLTDTDMYYCSWKYFDLHTKELETHKSNGTIIIVRGRDPYKDCDGNILDLILIVLSVTAFVVILFLFVGSLIWRCTRFKKHYRPAADMSQPRRKRHQHVCPQCTGQQFTDLSRSSDGLDFRGIL